MADRRRLLEWLGVCRDHLEWACAQPGSDYAVWRRLDGYRALWLAAAVGVDRRIIVTAACAVARTVLHLAADGQPLRTIEIAEAWARGEATDKEVRAAVRAGNATNATGAAYAAAAAAYSAAYSAAHASYSAAAGDHAAEVAAEVAADATAELGRVVRRHIPWRVVRDRIRLIEEVDRG